MRVLLISTNYKLIHASFFPIGLGYIAALLRKNNIDVKLLTISIDEDVNTLIDLIKKWKPRIIGLSATTSQIRFIKKIVQKIKEVSEAVIICGGIHPTLKPEETLREIGSLDAIVRGEGEYSLLDLVERLDAGQEYYNIKNFWFNYNGDIIRNEIRPAIEDLDTLSFPARELIDYQEVINKERGIARLLFSRGCIFNCTYCSNAALQLLYNNNNFRVGSPYKAIEEIDSILSKYKVKRLRFDDDTFTINKEWLYNFLRLYNKNFSCPFGCNIRPGTCTQDMFFLLKDAGCEVVHIGVESGDERLRMKVLNRLIPDDVIIQTFDFAHKAGIKTLSYNIIGFPCETPESFQKTIDLNAKIMPNQPYIYIFYPYPGTELERLIKLGNFEVKEDIIERAEVAFVPSGFASEEIKYFYDNFVTLVNKACGINKYIVYIITKNIKKIYNLLQRIKYLSKVKHIRCSRNTVK